MGTSGLDVPQETLGGWCPRRVDKSVDGSRTDDLQVAQLSVPVEVGVSEHDAVSHSESAVLNAASKVREEAVPDIRHEQADGPALSRPQCLGGLDWARIPAETSRLEPDLPFGG